MAKPVLVVVDDDDASRQALGWELESRYGTHYRVVSSGSPAAALARLEELAAKGARVALILADQWMPEMTGTDFLTRANNVVPTARRALLISWPDRSAAEPLLEAPRWAGLTFT